MHMQHITKLQAQGMSVHSLDTSQRTLMTYYKGREKERTVYVLQQS